MIVTEPRALSVALAPKRFVEFFFREYIVPLSAAEKILLVAALLCSLVSAAGVQQRLAATYGPAVGWAGAVGLELVYVGTALAGTVLAGSTGLTMLALSTIAAGIAVVLNFAQHEAAGRIHWYSYVESVAFPLLAVGCSWVSHQISGARHAEETRETDRARIAAEKAAEKAEQIRLRIEYDREQGAIERERIKAQADAEVAKIQAKAASRRASQGVSRDATGDLSQPRHSASPSPKTVDRHALLPALRDAVIADPKFNRTEFAKLHGISRPMVNKLLAELDGYTSVAAAD